MKLFAPINNSKIAASKWAGRHWGLDILMVLLFFAIEQAIVMVALVVMLIVGIFKNLANIRTGAMDYSGLTGFVLDFTSGPAANLVMLYCTLAMIITILIFTKKKGKWSVRELGIKKEMFLPRYLGGLAIGFVMFSGAVFFCKITGTVSLSLSNDTNKYLIPFFVVAWMIQGFSEELLCRGWMMVSIGRRYSTLVAVVVNSIVFAALHLMNPGVTILAVINLLLFAVFASLLYLVSENIWMVAALHSVWNFVQGNFYGILVSGTPITTSIFQTEMVPGKEMFTGGDFGLEGGLGVTVVNVIGIAIVYMIYRLKNKQALKEES